MSYGNLIAPLLAAMLLAAGPAFAQTPPSGNTDPATLGDTGTPPTPDAGTPTAGDASAAGEPQAAEDIAEHYRPTPATDSSITEAARKLKERLERVNLEGQDAQHLATHKARIGCWLDKMVQGADDRLIEWTRICPSLPTGPATPSSVCQDFAVNEERLYELVRQASDVETANGQLHFMLYGRSEAKQLHTAFPSQNDDAFVVSQLVRLARDVEKARTELGQMATSTERGGMPRHYRAIKAWIDQKRGDSNSLYSCN